jgi:hypothetical protein
MIATLTACETVNVIDQGDQNYQVRFTDPTAGKGAASTELGRESIKLCPQGYEGRRDFVEVIDGKQWFVWDIKCT